MKTLIQIPGDGNCLFNAILIGYVGAHNGQYPVINGLEIRTQHQLREAVQQHYQTRIDASDETLIECLKGMLIDIIKLKNFSGFGKARSLKNKLESIRSNYDSLAEDQDLEEFLNIEVNQDLIQLYIDSITSIWGSWQETLILRDLLDTNIRLSGQGIAEENEIEVMYIGGNHYNVYVNDIKSSEVSDLISAIGGEQVSKDKSILSKQQVSKISALSDYQLHIFLQIIFNKREAEKRDIDCSITDEEVNYAMVFIKEITQSSIVKESKSDGSCTDDYNEEISPLKPKNWALLFESRNKKSSAGTIMLSNEEKYDRYYDDTSSEEGDREEIENSRLKNLKAKAQKLKEKIVTLKEVNVEDNDLELSFLAHEFGIRVLASTEVYKHYLSLKDKHLAKNTVLTDEQISKLLKSAFKKSIKKTYEDNHQELLEENQAIIDTLINEILEDKRTFIKSIHEKSVVKKNPTLKESLKLPSKTKKYNDDELAELIIEIHEEIGEQLTPKPGDTKSAYLKSKNQNSRPKLQEYKSESPIKQKLAEELRITSKKTIKTFLESLSDIKTEKIKLIDIFISNFESELLTALDKFSKDKVYRETLPSHFDISFNSEDYDIAQFLAYIRLLKVSNIRLIKNYRDNTNILNDDIETLSIGFSLLGLESGGLESHEVSKKTGTRSDIVGIGKAGGSTSYAAIAKILNNKSSYLGITDADIAKWIIDVLEGKGNEFISKLEINRFQKEMLEKFINSLTYLMFSTEVARNPASLIINYMILELIGEEYLSWKDIFEDRQMPMSIVDAVKTSRWMHANYDTTIRYSYDKTTSSLSNDNGEKDMKILEDIINKEAAIFRLWLSLNGLEYEDESSFSEVIALLTQKCSQWYGVTVLSKSLIIDLLADLLEKETKDMEDAFNKLEHEELENLLEIASNEDTKIVLDWYFEEEDIEDLYNNILGQIANLGSSELEELVRMVRKNNWGERDIICNLLDYGLELSKCIAILENAIDHLDRSFDADFDLNEITRLDTEQLEQLDEMISEDKDFLLKLNSDIKLEELLEIHSDYSDDQEKLEAFLDKEFLSLRADYKKITKSSISFEDFYELYKGNENKLRFLLNNEHGCKKLIKKIGYDTVSEAFDQVCEDEGIDQDNLSDIDDDEIDIYQLICDKLENFKIINSGSDEEISVNFCLIKYDNEILNTPKGQKLFELAAKNNNLKAINLLLELGKDKFFAEQIMLLIDELGAQQVFETLFDNKVDPQKQSADIAEESYLLPQTQDQQTLGAIAGIEAIIGKDALSQITGFYQYASSALSNSPYAAFSGNVIQAVSSLMQSLQDTLDLSYLYQSINLDNQVAILLTQLDNVFFFLASGPIQVGLPPRPPHFDPDDGDYGGFGNGGNSIKNDENNTYSEVISIPLYSGVNSTFIDT